ncbi:MAG: P-loop NTPase, partial [Chitinivibrionales bacterium]|nr:P-loop NTPase [Chitinivibrionales bacterium]MBD3396437.1 P-loop NTPase [Chitinivibrionales bacterium]
MLQHRAMSRQRKQLIPTGGMEDNMVITIASGKGGTGKTTLAVNLAYVLAKRGDNVRLLDCDVEEPNDHLFVEAQPAKHSDVMVPKPVLDEAKCTGCGACAEACNYQAIAVVKGKVLLFNELCHSCGVCAFVCPQNAFHERETKIGAVHETSADSTPFFAYGKLDIGETLAPKVVEAV